jgi:hypothetical protein
MLLQSTNALCPSAMGGHPVIISIVLQRWWPWDRHAYGLHYDIEVDLRKHAGRYRVVRQVSIGSDSSNCL